MDPTRPEPAPLPEYPALTLPKRRPAWTRWAALGLVAILVGGGAFGWSQWSQRTPPVKYVTSEVDRGTITAKVTASGTLAASRTVDVGSQVSGRVSQLFVDFNSPVKKGQVLARIDPQLLQATRQQAQANYISAEASLRRAQAQAAVAGREAQRSAQLVKQGFIAAAEMDTARTNAEVARAQVTVARAALDQARASLRQADVNLEFTSILSPIDGVVISRNVAVGQTVAASLQAPVLFALAQDLRQLEVHTHVAEADVGRLKPGMPVEFTVDAYPGEPFKGKVRQIRNAPQTVQNVVTYDAVLDVPNPDLRLKIGMTANVSFIEDQREDALRVPNTALRFRPTMREGGREGGREGWRRRSESPAASGTQAPGARDQAEAAGDTDGNRQERQERRERRGGKRVFVLNTEGKLKPVRVQTGLSDGSFTEIVSGELNEGDAVVTAEEGPAGSPSPRPRQGGGMGGGRRGGGFF